MPAATKGGTCWRFFSNYCCTLPPLIPARLTSWRKNSNWYMPPLWNCLYTKRLVFLVFLPFSPWKRSYLKFLLNSKRMVIQFATHNRLNKKIFSLRHHGVKLFWTKVWSFFSNATLIRVNENGTRKTNKYVVIC